MLACHEAVGGKDPRFLARALQVAKSITSLSGGNPKGGPYIWEHYNKDWSPDMSYNKGDKTNIFRFAVAVVVVVIVVVLVVAVAIK